MGTASFFVFLDIFFLMSKALRQKRYSGQREIAPEKSELVCQTPAEAHVEASGTSAESGDNHGCDAFLLGGVCQISGLRIDVYKKVGIEDLDPGAQGGLYPIAALRGGIQGHKNSLVIQGFYGNAHIFLAVETSGQFGSGVETVVGIFRIAGQHIDTADL